MKKISWTDRVKNKNILNTLKEERNIPPPQTGRKANWNCHILRRNRFLKHVIGGRIEGTIEVMEGKN